MRRKWSHAKRVSLALIAFSAAIGIAVLVSTGIEVLRQLRALETAVSDNVQWTLTQAEVEFLEFDLALTQEMGRSDPDLKRVRRRFDVFYSRVATLRTSPVYVGLREAPAYDAALEKIGAFLEEGVGIVDAQDAQLAARLSDLAAAAEGVRAELRALTVAGLNQFIHLAEQRREGVAVTLLRLAEATAALFSILLLAAWVLWRQNCLSDRRAAELRRASRHLTTIVGASLDAIIVADTRGRILEFNKAAEQTFGHRRIDVLGREMGDLIVPERYRKAHAEGLDRYRRTGQPRVVGKGRVLLEAMRANGEVFPCEFAIQSEQTEHGEVFVGFLRDVSVRVAAQNALVEARDRAVAGEKAKTEFLAMMSHEIRTPLNGLLGTLTLLKDTHPTPRQAEYLRKMEASGDILLHHVNDVLDITKYEAGKLDLTIEAVDLGEFVQGLVDNQRDLASAANNVLTWTWTGPPLTRIGTDRLRLRQVLMNLVGNAVKFTRDGRITLEVEAIGPTDAPERLRFSVIDTGIGIPQDQIPRIFNDFETGDWSYDRQSEGTGLGLGIARRMTEALGGTIGAESVPGVGSTFWVEIPCCPAPEGETAVPADTPTGPSRPLRLLVVEDNEINRSVLCDMLEADGHEVVAAANGREGVDMAAMAEFDVILMDISMPVLDGRQATRLIRDGGHASSAAVILALTAHALPSEIEDFRNHGMDGVLSKPIARATLRAWLADPAPHRMPAPAETAPAVNDDARLEAMIADYGVTRVATLLARFTDEAGAAVPLLAAAEGGWPEVAARAHRLAGSAGTFGAVRLHAHLNEIETAATKRPDPAEARRLCAALPAVYDQTMRELHKVLSRH